MQLLPSRMPVIYSSTHNEIDNDRQIDLGVGNFVQAVVGHSLEFLLCADGAERAVIHNDQWCCGVRPGKSSWSWVCRFSEALSFRDFAVGLT